MQLFKSEPVEFKFSVPPQQAIENLAKQVTANVQAQTDNEAMLGKVTQDATFLYRSVRGSRNSFRPTFYGRFTDNGSTTTLSGEITLNRVIKKFIVFWCAIVALIAVFTLITVLRNPNASWGSLLQVLAILGAFIGFFHFMIKKSMPDVAWLKSHIVSAVTH